MVERKVDVEPIPVSAWLDLIFVSMMPCKNLAPSVPPLASLVFARFLTALYLQNPVSILLSLSLESQSDEVLYDTV